MSGMACSFSTPAVALSAATARTAVQLTAPTNQRLMIRSMSISCDGVSPTAVPVLVRVLVQTSAGTNTAGTEVLHGAGSETPQGAITHSFTSTEPTNSAVLWTGTCPAYGAIKIDFPWNTMLAIGGQRVGIELTAAATVNAYVSIDWDE